jgi:hypothetical protein
MKPNIRTLNGIRTAQVPSGRDVAEAIDDLSAAIAKLSAAAPASAVAPVQPSFSPTAPKNPTVNPTSTPGTGGGGSGPSPAPPVLQVVEVTGDYTTGISDYCVEVDSSSNCTIQLTGIQMGTTLIVKNYSSSGIVITVEDSNSGTIDGSSNIQMEWKNTSGTFIFDGVSNWAIA